MKKHLTLAIALGFAATSAAPALAECSWGQHASKTSDKYAMSAPADEKSDEAMSTFEPSKDDTVFKPEAKTETPEETVSE